MRRRAAGGKRSCDTAARSKEGKSEATVDASSERIHAHAAAPSFAHTGRHLRLVGACVLLHRSPAAEGRGGNLAHAALLWEAPIAMHSRRQARPHTCRKRSSRARSRAAPLPMARGDEDDPGEELLKANKALYIFACEGEYFLSPITRLSSASPVMFDSSLCERHVQTITKCPKAPLCRVRRRRGMFPGHLQWG